VHNACSCPRTVLSLEQGLMILFILCRTVCTGWAKLNADMCFCFVAVFSVVGSVIHLDFTVTVYIL